MGKINKINSNIKNSEFSKKQKDYTHTHLFHSKYFHYQTINNHIIINIIIKHQESTTILSIRLSFCFKWLNSTKKKIFKNKNLATLSFMHVNFNDDDDDDNDNRMINVDNVVFFKNIHFNGKKKETKTF